MTGGGTEVTMSWSGLAESTLMPIRSVVQSFNEPGINSVVDELAEKLDDFRRAHFAGSISPSEYLTLDSVKYFHEVNQASWKSVRDIAADLREKWYLSRPY
jgi:hypothetical protein